MRKKGFLYLIFFTFLGERVWFIENIPAPGTNLQVLSLHGGDLQTLHQGLYLMQEVNWTIKITHRARIRGVKHIGKTLDKHKA